MKDTTDVPEDELAGRSGVSSVGNFRHSREKASRFAVLGMLSLGQPLSGYALRRQISESTAEFWSESYGNIYPVLKRLEAEGAIAMQELGGAGPRERGRLYGITGEGRTMLEAWLRQPARPVQEDNELLLKLFFHGMLAPEESRALIAEFRREVTARMLRSAAIEALLVEGEGTREQKVCRIATLRYGQAVNQALAAWCDETTSELEKLASVENHS